MAWKKIGGREKEKPVAIVLAGKRIRRRMYGVGRCFVSNAPCIAVKAGKKRFIGKRSDVLDWLTQHGLALKEARLFVHDGLVLLDTARRFAEGR